MSTDAVDDKNKKTKNKDETSVDEEIDPSVLNKIDGEDLLWSEILKTLDKLEKGVEGDLSALSRATRNINRFRKRLPSTTWLRILHTIIPSNHKNEFDELLQLFIKNKDEEQIKLISKLAAVSMEEAKTKLASKNNDVFGTLMEFIAEKEKIAKIEIAKKQQQLKKERLAREKKKDTKEIEAKNDKNEQKKNENAMEIDSENVASEDSEIENVKITLLPLKDGGNEHRKFYPETFIFFELLIALELFDRNEYKLSSEILLKLITFCKDCNRRTCDILSSRLYQFYALCHLKMNDGSLWTLRSFLFDNYQRACLQQNNNAQSVLIVLILQCYICANLYSLAHKFVQKADFWEGAESQYFARYHYYRGCIECVELNYSNALYYMEQAIRRAPQNGAYGFKINSTRWLIVIALLMGDVPDTNIFKPRFDDLSFSESLQPFLEITECVKEGELKKYEQCLKKYDALFTKCGLSKILLRLRHNVIKTGLRKINKAYSKISLVDIGQKLGLSSPKNAYFIVSKAIRDGVINAKINYLEKCVESTQNADVYSTDQPYLHYSQRIKFCLEIRNNAVKSLRYPANNEEEEEGEKNKVDDDHVSPEEIAQMIQKHFDEEDAEEDD